MAELDLIAQAAGEQKAPKDIHAFISTKRRARKVDPPKIWAVRRAVKGTTHLRDRTKTRGRKPKMTPEVVRQCIRVRIRGLVFCSYVPYKLYKPGYKPAYKLLSNIYKPYKPGNSR